MKNLLLLLLFAFGTTFIASAQLQLDKPLQMTGGTNSDRRITNVGDPADTSDAVNAGSLQSGVLTYAAATGSANNYVVVLTPAPAAYTAGMIVNFKANHTNTGAATLKVGSLAAIDIRTNVTNNLAAGDIKNSQMVSVIYDGANFQLLSGGGSQASLPPSGAAGGDLTGTYPNPDIATNAVTTNEIANGTIAATDLANTGVGAGTYNTVTVNTQGQVTGATNTTYLTSETDASITNEGSLSVDPGTSNTSVIQSNTSGSPSVTLTAGSNISLSEAGNNITINSTGDGSITNEGGLTVGAGSGTTSLLQSNTSGSTDVTVQAGSGISVSEPGGNTIQITNASPDQTVSITGAGINNVTGTYPNFTVTGTEVDGSITNEGSLTVGAGAANTSLLQSNTNSSTNVTFSAGSGITLGEPGSNTISIANASPDQTVSITGAGINNVTGTYPNFTVTGTEADGSITNEGSLSVGAGTGTTSLIQSNTSGSGTVTLTAGNNITLSEAGNDITIASNTNGTVTNIGTGTGLTGGPITGTGVISIANTAVTPGTYSSVTVNQQGQVTAATNPGFTTGSGSAGHVSYWNSTTNQTYDSDGTFYWDESVNGLGIGVAPNNILDLYRAGATPTLQFYSERQTSNPSSLIENSILFGGRTSTGWSTEGGAGIDFSVNYTAPPTQNANLNLWAYPNSSASPVMSLYAGNVGIGTTTPGQKLVVNGGAVAINTGAGAQTFNDLNIGGFGGWSTNEAHRINFSYSTTDAPLIVSTIETAFDGAKANMHFRNFHNGGSPQTSILMTVAGDGNVGIGNPAPAYGLQVERNNGSGWAAFFRTTSSANGLLLGTISSTGTIQGYNGTSNQNIFLNPNGGNVGIATTANPATTLEVNGTAWLRSISALGRGASSWDTYGYEVRISGAAGTAPFTVDAAGAANQRFSIEADGSAKVNNLAGTGNRAVYASATGKLTATYGPTIYTYTGGDQTYTVPAGVTSIKVVMWGAGGGSGGIGASYVYIFPGGAGGYTTGTVAVNPGDTYYIMVGQGGTAASTTTTTGSYGGGGKSCVSTQCNYSGQGGGRSAFRNTANTADILTAGGGGGGASNANTVTAMSRGGAGGGSAGQAGETVGGTTGGQGGDQNLTLPHSKGGVGATRTGTDGSQYQGGNAGGTEGLGGGGGGGYYGGGGGAHTTSAIITGGGGGSGYIGGAGATVTLTTTTPGNYTVPANISDIYYRNGIAVGGQVPYLGTYNYNSIGVGNGGHGLVVIIPQ